MLLPEKKKEKPGAKIKLRSWFSKRVKDYGYRRIEKIVKRQKRWGNSCLLEVRDDALARDGVNRGDYLVVDRADFPPGDDALVVIEDSFNPLTLADEKGSKNTQQKRLLLRKMEHIGSKVRLQPGSSPRTTPYIARDSLSIWGEVVAVMRKFEAA